MVVHQRDSCEFTVTVSARSPFQEAQFHKHPYPYDQCGYPKVVQTKTGRGRSFGKRLSGLLREAMDLREAYHRGEAVDFAAQAKRLKRELSYHLRDRPMADGDNYRLQNELGWHDDRGNLLRF